MKSVLIANSLETAIPATGLTGLTNGQLLMLDYQGRVVDQTVLAELAKDDMPFHFVVGTGNGNYLVGQWLGARTLRTRTQDYTAPTAITYTIDLSGITDDMLLGYDRATIDITTDRAYSADFERVFVAGTYILFEDTVTDVTARLARQLEDVLSTVDRYYGAGEYTIVVSGTTITISAPTFRQLGVTIGGALTNGGTITRTGDPIGVGTPERVKHMMYKYGIPTWGDNPNYRRGYDPFDFPAAYGTDNSTGYDQISLEAEVGPNHPFYPEQRGMTVTQFIACATGGSVITDIVALLGYTSHIPTPTVY